MWNTTWRRFSLCFQRSAASAGGVPSTAPSGTAAAPAVVPGGHGLEGVNSDNFKNNASVFGLRLQTQVCKVVKVYDGDTVTIVWLEGQQPSRSVYASCRLQGIDTPELRTKDAKEKEQAVQCRDMLASVLLNERVLVSTSGRTGLDKYGRPLVTLHASSGLTSPAAMSVLGQGTEATSVNVNEWALAHLPGCVKYDGGTKVNRSQHIIS